MPVKDREKSPDFGSQPLGARMHSYPLSRRLPAAEVARLHRELYPNFWNEYANFQRNPLMSEEEMRKSSERSRAILMGLLPE